MPTARGIQHVADQHGVLQLTANIKAGLRQHDPVVFEILSNPSEI